MIARRRYVIMFLSMTIMGVVAVPVYAQIQNYLMPAPAEELPPLPTVQNNAAPPAQTPGSGGYAPPLVPTSYFPPLPPSRLCEEKDVVGVLWKLQKVYEMPTGEVLKHFTDVPEQFLLLQEENKIFKTYESNFSASDNAVKRKLVLSKDTDAYQYVLHESGVLFFYKNSELIDSQACFIVANRRDPFYVGQMLLMPPADSEKAKKGKLVKVYQNKEAFRVERDRKAREEQLKKYIEKHN